MGFYDEILNRCIEDRHIQTGQLPTSDELKAVIKKILPKSSELILTELENDKHAMLRHEYECEREFRARLMRRWGDGIDLLVGLGVMCREIGEMALKESCPKPSSPKLPKFEALCRQHARACLIFQEVLCLIKGGFADGAMARWRSLHEIAVVSFLLSQCEPAISERFLEHQVVECHKRLSLHQKYVLRLKHEPFEDVEVEESKQLYEEVCKKYGEGFSSNYGWAGPALGKPKPYFSDIEEKVGIDHLRPYYKWACEKNHSSANSLYRALGLFEREDIMLAGPSSFGLADPAQLSAISLVHATVA